MLDALTHVDAPHALFGGLLAEYYGRRRETSDVDMLVPRSAFEPLKAIFKQRGYAVREFPFLLKIVPRGQREPVGDLVVAESNAVIRTAFALRIPAEIFGMRVSIVPRGAFVALKFEAAVRSKRQWKDRVIDLHDIRNVLHRHFTQQDELLATALAQNMFPGAATQLESVLNDLRMGKWPRVMIRAEMRAGLLRRQGAAAMRRAGLFRGSS